MKVKFSNDDLRKSFFDSIKTSEKTWKEIRNHHNISKSVFDGYKSGRFLIPEELFLNFVNLLTYPLKKEVFENIEMFPDNYGQVKGGKNAYKINFNKFWDGRKKGLISFVKSKKKRTRQIKKFLFDISISPEICEFVGAFIGDGFFNCYNNKNYQIELTGDSEKDISYHRDYLTPNISKVFPNLRPKFYKSKFKNVIRVRFYSKELFFFLKDVFGFIPGKKAHTVKIPQKILILPKNFIYSTVRGIFDTDGGIYMDKRKIYKKPYPRIIFQTVSKELYTQLLEILSKDFKIYSRFNVDRNIYIIEIYGFDQLRKWMSLIGFSNKRHLNKVALVA